MLLNTVDYCGYNELCELYYILEDQRMRDEVVEMKRALWAFALYYDWAQMKATAWGTYSACYPN